MDAHIFAVVLVALYALITLAVSLVGMRKTGSLESFAIGNGDMSPYLVGITMAASIASTATFVINPGFIYTDGLAAWAHYGPAASAGVITALLVVTRQFRRQGKGALTLPDWIQQRYASRLLGYGFALLCLLYISFVVLILAGSAMITEKLFGIGYHTALVGILIFVFSYTLLGGTYAHAYTNAFQGILMLVVSLVLFLSGWKYLGSDFATHLENVSPDYSMWLNPKSTLYHSWFSVFGSSFVVTFALMLQPHILTKALYIQNPKDMRAFLVTTIVCGLVFSSILFVGFYAQFGGVAVERQDQAVIEYVATTFNPYMMSFVLVTLLAAGMSTLDGILVSLSSIVVVDLVLPLSRPDTPEKFGLFASRVTLVAIGLISLVLAWDPPAFLGLFAQQGVYGLVAATSAPMLLGLLTPQLKSAKVIAGLAALAVVCHFCLQIWFGINNPSVSAAIGILTSCGLGIVLAIPKKEERRTQVPTATAI